MDDRIADVWGPRTPYGRNAQWPVRVDQYIEPGVAEQDVAWVQSACVLCSQGCGMDVAVHDGRMVGVRGRSGERVNHGRLGPKGLFGWQANDDSDRLTQPLVRRDGRLEPASWDEAMALVVERSRHVLTEHGPLGLAFYNSGQLFLEDYYTLGVIVRAGIGSPHLDGNTRLCTATSDFALKESFGTDGAPGSLADFDLCDTIFSIGHNIAETHTVLWMRVLDRLHGPDRPRLVVVDPRRTKVAAEADVHLAIRNGTNLALLNGIQRALIVNDWIDREFIDAHTIQFEKLEKAVIDCTPERVADICGVEPLEIERAAEIIGTAEALVSTCLQGVYQSHQATASACQVNNIALMRAMIGKPGCSVFQMNGQPTAQNTRETGADGDFAGMRNWQNPEHVAELARHWNVEPLQLAHWSAPSHVMQIFRYAEAGSIRFLWVMGTNPAVSLPELGRIRSILKDDRLFVVVSDAFLTETGALADVVLPAAIWGEKTGTFTNHDRTVHLSEQAIQPPGEARPDMEILLDYARRMHLVDKDGAPLLKWESPEQCFDAFKQITRGRPCDYSGLSYQKLRGSTGIQWPCNAEHPDGTERLYTDFHFNTDTAYTEDYGHDLLTGAAFERKDHANLNPAGKAMFRAAQYLPANEQVSDDYPLLLTTGRTVYHWHTRTKTGRAPQLDAAAPTMWIELSRSDADGLEIREGDLVRVESARGWLEAPARITHIRDGVVFAPFHYGYWDHNDVSGPDGAPTAANELTITAWDPVSKQPTFKTAAVRVVKVEAGTEPAPAPTTTASAPAPDGAPPSVASGINQAMTEESA